MTCEACEKDIKRKAVEDYKKYDKVKLAIILIIMIIETITIVLIIKPKNCQGPVLPNQDEQYYRQTCGYREIR